jgi:transcriptional regulator with XRE-family HTH domain
MATDLGPVVMSVLLRGELVRLRKARQLTQEQVAAALEWSTSKLIRVEGGRSSITKVDLDALMDQYGVTSESQRERMQALNRGARGRAWWDDYRDVLSPEYVTFVGYEAGASFIRQYQDAVVPGLLQTADYARVLTAATIPDQVRIPSVVDLRLRRQSVLAERMPPPRQYFVLDEAVLRRHIGIEDDPAIMPGQLRRIAAVAQRDGQVTVRVIPFTTGAHVGLSGPFTLLEFDGDIPDILYFDRGRDIITTIVGEDPRVTEYAAAFEQLLGGALSTVDSIDFILDAAERMSRDG